MPTRALALAAADFVDRARSLVTKDEIIRDVALTCATYRGMQLHGIWRLPRSYTDFDYWQLDQTVFMHPDMRTGFWEEYSAGLRVHRGTAASVLLRYYPTPITVTEAMQRLQPTASDRWAFDLLLKYQVRDGLYCPVKIDHTMIEESELVTRLNDWNVLFRWMANTKLVLTDSQRGLLHMIAVAAATRLHELTQESPKSDSRISPRHQAVLRHASNGLTDAGIARELGISQRTVETHFKELKRKFGTETRAHAVAEAMRRGLIA